MNGWLAIGAIFAAMFLTMLVIAALDLDTDPTTTEEN